ncbi:MAG: exonuclease domain-containing protein [Bacteroidetes bacterium]|nr:exonuclease domain-containing protein [Bacteroidota bacterium]
MKINDTTFVIVDLETTGLQSAIHRIIEIGAIKVRAGRIEETFSSLVDPGCRIPRQITKITGITSIDVAGKPEISEVLPSFVEFVNDAIFVAHNCSFDWSFIEAELSRAGLPTLKNRQLCTVRLANRLLSGLPSKSLGSLINFFELQPDSRHRALSDAGATQQIFFKLLDRLEKQYEIIELDELLRFQNTQYAKKKSHQQRRIYIQQNILQKLPRCPGVYRMIGKAGNLLYVGKARVLSDRVRSYFAGKEGHAPHVREMIQKIHDIKWTQTTTELEALLLESQLIKEHAPSFNKAGRSYRHWPFLRLGKIGDIHWVTLIEHIRADGAVHYGPMGSRREVILVAQGLISLYGISPGSFRFPERAGVGLETARIGGPLTEEGYLQAVAFLEGRDPGALDLLKTKIGEASEAKEYELAAQRRDSLDVMKTIHARPKYFRTALLDRTGAILYKKRGQSEVHFMTYGSPVAHVAWPCDQKTFDEARGKFHKEVLHPPDRLTMQQVDAIRLLGAWMFKERDNISVLTLEAQKPPATFDAELELQLRKTYGK